MRIPGEWLLCDQPVEINVGRRRQRLSVRNTGDRPIQVGSHFHFFEVNRALEFDRAAALGMRLDVPSGQSIRFEAGDERDIELVQLGGSSRVIGFSNLLNGSTSAAWKADRAIARVAAGHLRGASDGKGSR
jgi:urease subunit beta/urease subunit gamma/beta